MPIPSGLGTLVLLSLAFLLAFLVNRRKTKEKSSNKKKKSSSKYYRYR